MAAKRTKRSSRSIKKLPTRKLSSRETHEIRGGYIGETEKSRLSTSHMPQGPPNRAT
jgi:hypothetical protein